LQPGAWFDLLGIWPMTDQPTKDNSNSRRYVVMGVSGCGKSEIGRRLAARLGIDYVEGDEYHPADNIAKMAAGVPLDDNDRRGWLLRLRDIIENATRRNIGLVLTCSALKRRYRDLLRTGDSALTFIYLHGDKELIASRMKKRAGHFMPQTLLESQYRDLEPPEADERAVQVDIEMQPDAIVNEIVHKLAEI
jgi:gluconokinase